MCNIKWYIIAQVKNKIGQSLIPKDFKLVSLEDIIKLYQLELDYSNYLNKDISKATQSEYLRYLHAKDKLEKLVDRIGDKFYNLAKIVGYSSVTFHDYSEDDYVDNRCPNCFDWLAVEEKDFKCDNCGFNVDKNDFIDYVDTVDDEVEKIINKYNDFIVENELFTDYGMEYITGFIGMWENANMLNKKIIALQYMINALHVSGPLVTLFIDGKKDIIINMLSRLSKNADFAKWYFSGNYAS